MATAVESHPTSSFNAPSPFITAKGNAFDHLLPGYKVVDGQGYALYEKEIIKSPNDDRTYRYALDLTSQLTPDPKSEGKQLTTPAVFLTD